MRMDLTRLANIAFIAALGGCSNMSPPPAPPPPMATPYSFDGTYRGTIKLTSSAARGAQSNWCDTPPAITFVVQNNRFNYVLAHPNVPKDGSLSPEFSVPVAPDGSFDATSPNGTAEMTGLISASRITGQIMGTGCGYSFTLNQS
jgi:hypothetical protein